MRTLSLILLALAGLVGKREQSDYYGDISGLALARPEDKLDVKPMLPPRGARILFDGKNLDSWEMRTGGKAVWAVADGHMQATKGDLVTREKFEGDFRLHVEFRVPYMPKHTGQARGNSGVYLQGRYEVQVLDSYGLKSKNNDCGAIYEVSAPLVNACKAPTVWQSFDIEFHPPKCVNGKRAEPAWMTVYHNNLKIQDKVSIPVDNTRAGMGGDVCQPGPIMLQFHGDPVQYRNIWLLRSTAN
jgi:hypothetical protein